MTLEQEFQKQWTSLCNFVKSEILKANSHSVDLNRIQTTMDNEKKKWFLPGQYNNAWFEKLQRTNPDVARNFEENLKSIKIEPVVVKKINSQIILIGTAVVGTAVGFGVSRILLASMLPSVLWTLGGTVVGLIIGTAVSTRKKNDMLNELCSAYEEQLKKAGEMLSQIVSQAN